MKNCRIPRFLSSICAHLLLAQLALIPAIAATSSAALHVSATVASSCLVTVHAPLRAQPVLNTADIQSFVSLQCDHSTPYRLIIHAASWITRIQLQTSSRALDQARPILAKRAGAKKPGMTGAPCDAIDELTKARMESASPDSPPLSNGDETSISVIF